MENTRNDFQLELGMPVHSWDDCLLAQDGTKLEREGSIKQAMAILKYKRPEPVQDLIKAGVIRGRKKNPAKINSPYVVDLLECWKYKQNGYRLACS